MDRGHRTQDHVEGLDRIRDIVVELWYSHIPEAMLGVAEKAELDRVCRLFKLWTDSPDEVVERRERMMTGRGVHPDDAVYLAEHWSQFRE